LDGHEGAAIIDHGELNGTVLSSNGVALTKSQVDSLLWSVTGPHPAYGIAKCYQPRHAFIFYSSAHSPVGFLELCFDCSQYRSSAQRPLGPIDLQALRLLLKALKIPVFDNDKEYLALKRKQKAKQSK
jgi:hypothetical protein